MNYLNLKYSFNTRDLGEYNTIYNRKTRNNIFIRSDVIEKLSDEELQYFKDNNILTIIDLRDIIESNKKPSYFKNNKNFKYYNVILKGKNIPKEKDIPFSYMEIINDKDKINQIIDIILKSNTGILFHCNLGKDRTGAISMILLLLAGVSDDDIINNYALSEIYLKDFIDNFHIQNPKLPKYIGRSKAKYMKKTLELFYNKYNNIQNYMYYLGFNDNDINIIQNRFISEK